MASGALALDTRANDCNMREETAMESSGAAKCLRRPCDWGVKRDRTPGRLPMPPTTLAHPLAAASDVADNGGLIVDEGATPCVYSHDGLTLIVADVASRGL